MTVIHKKHFIYKYQLAIVQWTSGPCGPFFFGKVMLYANIASHASRKLADGHLLFGISLEIPKRHLSASPGLQYKYAILKSGRKGKLLWEYLDKRNYFLKKFGENRILHVPLGRLNALKG